jgi:hypothetical protein
MNKTKAKRGQAKTCGWVVERVCLFITVVWIFFFNLLSLAMPVNLITHSTGAGAIASSTLIVLSMLFTFLATHLYYRLVRWLSTRQPEIALLYLVGAVIGFGILCILMAVTFITVEVILSRIFHTYWFDHSLILTVFALFVSPQLTIVTIWSVVAISVRLRQRTISLPSETQETLTLP